jgi:Bacterial RNA polymerase, alpha chain C terminal domain
MPANTPAPERNNRIAEMREKGAPFSEIGRRFGISAGRAQQIAAAVERSKRQKARFRLWELTPFPLPDDFLLERLPLTTRMRAALAYENITSAGQLARTPDEALIQLPNCGIKTLKELRKLCGQPLPRHPFAQSRNNFFRPLPLK